MNLRVSFTIFNPCLSDNFIFRPDNIKLYTMVAETQGTERLEGVNLYKITVSPTGFLSAFWSCSYYFVPTTLKFIGYKGVNGKPGTPETIIRIMK